MAARADSVGTWGESGAGGDGRGLAGRDGVGDNVGGRASRGVDDLCQFFQVFQCFLFELSECILCSYRLWFFCLGIYFLRRYLKYFIIMVIRYVHIVHECQWCCQVYGDHSHCGGHQFIYELGYIF